MSIDGIGTSASYLQMIASASSTSTSGAARSGTPGHITAAAEALGLSTDAVTQALSSGSSLADLAEQQGVSRDDLVAALVADAPEDVKASGNVEAMVSRLVDQTGMGPGGGAPQGPPPPSGVLGDSLTSTQQSVVDALADLLDTDSDTLISQLRDGADLGQMLEGSGVSLSAVASALQGGLLIDTTA